MYRACLLGCVLLRYGKASCVKEATSAEFGPSPDAALPPFSFLLGNDTSAAVLARSTSTSTVQPLDADRTLTTTVFYDAETSLVVTLEATSYAGLTRDPAVRGVEWVLHFANNGSQATPPLCAVYGVNMTFPDSAGDAGVTQVRRSLGSAASENDYAGVNETLSGGGGGAGGYTEFSPRDGRSSDGTALPFFTVYNSGGAGFTLSVGWSGSWAAAVRRGDASGAGSATQVWVRHDTQNGACPGVCTPLLPGEAFRTMRVLMVAFPAAGPDAYHAGVNAHRRLLVRYKVPRGLDGEVMGATSNALAWFGYPNCPAMTAASQLSLIAAIKAVPLEGYWLDAEWFNGCFPNGVGNWQLPLSAVIDQEELPDTSLAGLGAAAHAAPNPLQSILWVEPERVAPGTFIATHHPELLIPPNAPAPSQRLLDLGNAAARAYMTAFLTAVVADLNLDVLRLDFNVPPGPLWASTDAPGRDGVTQLRYVAGLYALWDAVLASKPGLLIDNCASGGRRIDLETLSRSVPLWRSDYAAPGQAAEAQQVQTMGLSPFSPVHAGTVDRSDAYMWRSGGAVGKTLIFSEAQWAGLRANATAMAALRAAQAETARLRDLAVFGDFYPLTPVALVFDACAAWQHHCDGRAECGGAVRGALHVFRRPAAPPPGCMVTPFAIDPAATYALSYYYDFALDHTDALVGAALTALAVVLPPNGTLLIEYSCDSCA